jgi:hypothetical protein
MVEFDYTKQVSEYKPYTNELVKWWNLAQGCARVPAFCWFSAPIMAMLMILQRNRRRFRHLCGKFVAEMDFYLRECPEGTQIYNT